MLAASSPALQTIPPSGFLIPVPDVGVHSAHPAPHPQAGEGGSAEEKGRQLLVRRVEAKQVRHRLLDGIELWG
jgi:hypothetical protein